jgi:uncharacterized Zn-finger protein
MAENPTPHFQNTDGHSEIEIPVKKFKCIGAYPPHDHPHIFLDMGKNKNIVCPYCSTKFTLNETLSARETIPTNCVVEQ